MNKEVEVVVPSTPREGAKVAVVGEAPGREEVEKGEGFVGRAGRVLNRILQSGGLTREEVSLYNVVKRPPRGGFDSDHFRADFYEVVTPVTRVEKELKRCECGKTKKQHESKKKPLDHEFKAAVKVTEKRGKRRTQPTEELHSYHMLLREELLRDRPNVVIAAGREALLALCGIDGISNQRGSVLSSTLVPDLKVIPLIHPSAILRGAQWQEAYVSGLIIREKVVPESKSPHLHRRGWETLPPTLQNIRDLTETIARSREIWCLDIETRGGSIACVGIGTYREGVEVVLCIPFQTTTGPYWETPELERDVWLCLDRAMDNPRLVGQNIMFDLDWLADYGLLPSGIWMDTMLAHHTLYPELPKGLNFLTMRYTDIPYYKDEGKTWGVREPDAQLWQYNLKDVVATLRVALALEKELHTSGKAEEYFGFTNALIPIAFEMQKRGFDVDLTARDFVRGVVREETAKVHQRLVEVVGREINTGSPKEVQRLLYEEMKLPVKRNRKTGEVTSDEDAVMDLVGEFPERKELRLLIAERHLEKAMDSYINTKLGE